MMFRTLAFTFLIIVSLPGWAMDRTRIAENAEQVTPLLNGQMLPDAMVKTVQGKAQSLKAITQGKPTLILFYRGGWCPYCNRQLAGLQQVEEKIVGLGYQILAISPDTPARLQQQQLKGEFQVSLISDDKLQAIRQFGLGFYLADDIADKYQNKLGFELTQLDGSSRIVLPVPAAYIVDENGLIQFSYVNPNYKVRVAPELLYQAAKLALEPM